MKGIVRLKIKRAIILVLSVCLLISNGCASKDLGLNANQKRANRYTKSVNESIYQTLNFSDKQEFISSTEGFIDAPENLEILDKDGNVIWSQREYEFVTDFTPSPASVNPSLWSNTQMNHYYGLFEVTKGVYQIRGYDFTNLTVVVSREGYIIIDALSNYECAKVAMDYVYEKIGVKPIKGIILTSSNINCYGGIKGIISDFEVSNNNIPIVAPMGFPGKEAEEQLFSQSLLKEISDYQNGSYLQNSENGSLSIGKGLHKTLGTSTYINPNILIEQIGQSITIDDEEFLFQPVKTKEGYCSQMHVFLPKRNALYLSENNSSTMRDFYSYRSSQLGAPYDCYRSLVEAISLYGLETEVVFGTYNWPHFGYEQAQGYMLDTARMYKLINDQTVSMIHQGKNLDEILINFHLPENLAKKWYLRPYEGTLKNNIIRVYTDYVGKTVDAVQLNSMNQKDKAKKLLEYMGDIDLILKKAQKDFDKGEYQWVAEITDAIIKADPSNTEAKYLCADALEQMGYLSESGTQRNTYLTAAKELREDKNFIKESSTKEQVFTDGMTMENMLDILGIMLDCKKCQNLDLKINIELIGTNKTYALQIKDGTLIYYKNDPFAEPNATLSMSESSMKYILNKNINTANNLIDIKGDRNILNTLDELLLNLN